MATQTIVRTGMQGRDFFMAWRIVRKHHRRTAEQAKSLDRPRQTGRQNSPDGIFADHNQRFESLSGFPVGTSGARSLELCPK
jgi:hypothetical protein